MAKSRFGFYMAHELEDPDNWEGEDYEIEWEECLKPGADWWRGTAYLEWGRSYMAASIQGEREGNSFREIETVDDLWTEDCLD